MRALPRARGSRFLAEIRRSPIPVSARVALSVVRQRIEPLSRPAVRFPGGRIEADLTTAQGLGFYRYRSFDSALRVLDRLQPGDGFVDAGANVGQFTLTAARAVGPAGAVWAFEPSPRSADALRRNVARNGYSWVTIKQLALDESAGTASFVTFEGAGDGLNSFAPSAPESGREITVDTAALDEVVPRSSHARIRLIKVDVEGAELRVLRGAVEILGSSRCAVLIEMEPEHLARQGASVEEVEEELRCHGLRHLRGAVDPPNALYVPD